MNMNYSNHTIIDTRRLDFPCWYPEEFLCLCPHKHGYELSVKVNVEISNYNQDQVIDKSEFDDDGELIEENYELPNELGGKTVSHWETSWSDGDLIILSTELEYGPGGEEPLKVYNNTSDVVIHDWLTKNFGSNETGFSKNNSQLIDIIRGLIKGDV